MKIFRLFLPLIIIASIFQRCQENDLVDTYSIDSNNSLVEWSEYTSSNIHSKNLNLMANDIKAERGRIKSGTFIIGLSTISDFESENKLYSGEKKLFKDTELGDNSYSPIVFHIKEVELLSGIHPTAVSGANWRIRGDMTMLGQTHQLLFPAKIKFSGNDMEIEAKITIDRTKWGMIFGNDPSLGDHQILPVIDLYLKGKASINNRIVI